MKHLLALLSVAVGLTVPLPSRADPAPSVDGGRSRRWLTHTEIIGRGDKRAVYYYTNIVLTGSHVPVVVRHYKGKYEIVAGASINGRSYSVGDLGTTGSNDVGGELAGLDPAITVGGGHR